MSRPFHLEFEFETFEKAGAPEGRERRIGGIVSTDDLDRQQEVLIQEGLDFGPFLKSGWFNDNHAKDTGAAVGFPELAELRTLPNGRKGWYVEGYLLKGHQRADSIWELATSLERSGAGRRLGFSIEGSIEERDPNNPKTVRKAVVREVAITRCPINESTQLSVLAKSLSAGAVGSQGGTPGDGAPLRVESLEGGTEDEEERKKAKSLKRSLTKGEAVRLLRGLSKGRMAWSTAARIVEYATRRKSA
jgi:hypothetical protein